MSAPELAPAPPDTGPVPVLSGIGAGIVFEPVPSVDVSGLFRCRMLTDRPELSVRAGETVLCAAYDPADLGMVVLVRCEADGHTPGALISAEEVQCLESVPVVGALGGWDKPGTRYGPPAGSPG